MSTFVIDAFEFCRLKEQAGGEWPVADLPRLASEETQDRVIKWSLSGGVDRFGHPQLRLAISGQVDLVCQRCLTTMPFQVSSVSVLVLAKDDDAADAIEALIDDEEIDVIVGDTAFDVVHLIEDEALLALPVAPRHDLCPAHVTTRHVAAEGVSPFSVLKNLKQ